MEKMYVAKDVAEMFDVTVITVYNWIKAGKLDSIKIGRTIRIPESAITEMMKGD